MVTNVELDHHSRWALAGRADRGVRALLRTGLRRSALPRRRRASTRSPGGQRVARFDADAPGARRSSCASRAATTSSTPARRSAALELAGFDARRRAARPWPSFPGMRRRLERKGRRDGAAIYDDYAHHPTEVAATLAALRELAPTRLIAVFQPHLYSRTKALARRLRRARSPRPTRSACSTSIRRARSRSGPLAGVSGLDVARAAADHAGGRPVLVARGRASAPSGRSPRGCATGDLLVTIGAGDVFRLADALVVTARGTAVSCPGGVERDYPLARLTTVRAGGRADLFARPDERASELVELLALGGGARASRSRWSARARTCWSPTTAFAAWC